MRRNPLLPSRYDLLPGMSRVRLSVLPGAALCLAALAFYAADLLDPVVAGAPDGTKAPVTSCSGQQLLQWGQLVVLASVFAEPRCTSGGAGASPLAGPPGHSRAPAPTQTPTPLVDKNRQISLYIVALADALRLDGSPGPGQARVSTDDDRVIPPDRQFEDQPTDEPLGSRTAELLLSGGVAGGRPERIVPSNTDPYGAMGRTLLPLTSLLLTQGRPFGRHPHHYVVKIAPAIGQYPTNTGHASCRCPFPSSP